jgi:peptide deformylase
MKTLNGIGLAAPQIGKKLPVIVYSVGPDEGCMINPVITDRSDKIIESTEGCLSFPGIKVKVPRYESVRVQFQDEDGQTQIIDAEHLLARMVQHETDHLLGKTMLDYVPRVRRDILTRKLQKNSRYYKRYLKRKLEAERKQFKQLAKEFKDCPELLTPPKVS